MTKTKITQTQPKLKDGKGSLEEAKTNEDFNKKTTEQNDPMLKVKKVKK